MEANDFEVVQMELKYCERCGGLWVRVRDSGEAYCPQCVAQMLDLPVPRARKKPDFVLNDIEVKSQCEEWDVFFSEGGNA